MSVLWNLALAGLLQSYLVDTQPTLTCQVNNKYVSCPPKTCPEDRVIFTYNASYVVGSILFKFPNDTCSNASFPNTIRVDQGAATCNGPSGNASCGPFNGKSIDEGSTKPCLAAILITRINSIENYSIPIKNFSIPIELGTSTLLGKENITMITEIFLTENPGCPHISVNSGLTNLTVIWNSPSSGGSADYYHVTLSNGILVVYDVNNVTSNQQIFINLMSNTQYEVQVAAINCASNCVNSSSAFTLSNPPSNITAVKKEIDGNAINLTVNWIHVGGSVTGYQIALKCCNAVPMLADVETYCKTPLSCSFSKYLTLEVDKLTFLTVSAYNSGGIGPESELIAVTKDGTNEGQDILGASLGSAVAVAVAVAVVGAIVLVKYLWSRKHRNNLRQNASNTGFHGVEGVDSGPNGDIYYIGIHTNDVLVNAEVKQRSELVVVATITQCCISLPLKSSDQMNVNVSMEVVNYLKGLFNKTMPNIDIFDVKYIVNQEMLTRYVNCAARIKNKYADRYKEKLMFRGTSMSSPESMTRNSIGYGQNTKGSWGHGYYFTEDAIHADLYAYEPLDTQKRELTFALVITGNCYDVSPEETPPKEDPVRHEAYDSYAGKRKSSKDAKVTSNSCVVFDIAQTCPVISFSYEKSSSSTTV